MKEDEDYTLGHRMFEKGDLQEVIVDRSGNVCATGLFTVDDYWEINQDPVATRSLSAEGCEPFFMEYCKDLDTTTGRCPDYELTTALFADPGLTSWRQRGAHPFPYALSWCPRGALATSRR